MTQLPKTAENEQLVEIEQDVPPAAKLDKATQAEPARLAAVAAGPALSRLAAGERDSADILSVRELIAARMLRKLGSSNCDLWNFLREDCHYSNQEIFKHLTMGLSATFSSTGPGNPNQSASRWSKDALPALLWSWCEMLAVTLLRTGENRCQCAERYHSFDCEHNGGRSRKYTSMQEACERNHSTQAWLNDAASNLLRALHYAIDGDSNLFLKQQGQFRSFGNSMLCAILTTPAESGLYLWKDADGKEYLVDERQFAPVMRGQAPLPNRGGTGSTFGALVWVCHSCRHVIGSSKSSCTRRDCIWDLVQVDREIADTLSETESTSASKCKNNHVWPGRGPCPECQREPQKRKKIDIFINQLRYTDLVP